MTKLFAAFNFLRPSLRPPSLHPLLRLFKFFVTVSVSFTESRNSIFKVTHNSRDRPVSVLTSRAWRRSRRITYIGVSLPPPPPLPLPLWNMFCVCFMKISSIRLMIHFWNGFTPLCFSLYCCGGAPFFAQRVISSALSNALTRYAWYLDRSASYIYGITTTDFGSWIVL